MQKKLSLVQPAMEAQLLPWFSKHRRKLPWRVRRTPYRVWVSEIMLQQTRVDTVIDYYQRWMAAFPSWRALAAAPQHDVLKAWEGLGYYSRARNLHAAAKLVTATHRGNLEKGWKAPGQKEQPLANYLQEFPGIGAYTGAAIASLAFGEDAAVVDGNVIRVLCRLFAFGGETKDAAGKKMMQAWAEELMVCGRAGESNESMMELGATVCTPTHPSCDVCPMQTVCAAHREGTPGAYPVMKKKKKVPHIVVGAAATMNETGEVLIAQRRQGDMLGGLWEFPGGKLEPDETIEACIARELKEELDITIEVGAHLITVKHTYSHFKMTMHVHLATVLSGTPRLLECADFRWVKIEGLNEFAYSKADLYVVEKLQQTLVAQ